jgi:3-oxoacyl-[acyl-carrier protein] reductase
VQRYAGRRVVIAGAGRGAGRALAVIAAQEGARVVMGARDKERLARTVEIARRAGASQAEGFTVDFSRRPQAERFFRRAHRSLGEIDTVFCLTGGWFEGELRHQTEKRVEEAYESFLRPTLIVNQVAPHYLKGGHHPALVNFSSATGGAVSTAGQTLYNAMKAAVAEVTRSGAADLLGEGIRVNAVLPGAVSHAYHFGREYRSRRRLGAAPGTPEDVAHAALFLASPEASWITGATLIVDGGFSVNRRTKA